MSDFTYKLFTPFDPLSEVQVAKIAEFVQSNLPLETIERKAVERAMQYAMNHDDYSGGFVLLMYAKGTQIASVAIVNKTGMNGYFPASILVYYAADQGLKTEGLDERMIRYVLKICEGDVLINLEGQEKFSHLYTEVGFDNRPLFLRYPRESVSYN